MRAPPFVTPRSDSFGLDYDRASEAFSRTVWLNEPIDLPLAVERIAALESAAPPAAPFRPDAGAISRQLRSSASAFRTSAGIPATEPPKPPGVDAEENARAAVPGEIR